MKRNILIAALLAMLTGCAAVAPHQGVSEADSEMDGRFLCRKGKVIGAVVVTNGPGTWTLRFDADEDVCGKSA